MEENKFQALDVTEEGQTETTENLSIDENGMQRLPQMDT